MERWGYWALVYRVAIRVFEFFWSTLQFMWIFKVLILLNKTTPQLEEPCTSPDANLFMLISWHWTNSIGSSEQQPIEIIQCERIGAPDVNVSCANPRTLESSCSRVWAFRVPMIWHSGFQVSDNERPAYRAYRMPNWNSSRSKVFQARGGFIKQNINFEKS
jgi:hypothetical protein